MEPAAKPIVWDRETLIRFWAYHKNFPEQFFAYRKGADFVRHARRYLKPGMRVLDYGCGHGLLIPHLLKAGCRVAAADIDTSVIGETARGLVGTPGFLGLFSFEELLERGEKFECVLLTEVVEHLDDGPLAETMANCRSLLADDGVFIVTTPNEENLAENTVYCPVSNVMFHRWQHVRNWNRDTLRATLGRHGFDVLSVKALTFRDATDAALKPLRRIAQQMMVKLRKPHGLMAVARLEQPCQKRRMKTTSL